jgi:Domain of unknown function (DUF1814).
MAKILDAATMREAFSIMGRYLADRKTLGEVAVFGGSAIALTFEWMRRGTNDVDAVVTSDGNHGVVRAAADEAARRLGLERSWLSESVAMYRSRNEARPDLQVEGMYPDHNRPGLRVVTATPEYILAMKMIALERSTRDDRDFSDAVAIGAAVGISGEDDLLGLVRQYYGDAVPEMARLRIGELAEAIAAARAGRDGPP